ncbi:MAG: glycosyltransferase [Polaribacter sp.]|uniref:glycosyltransferase n=1 Tax=Polaribacter sp. TaxID=1920175 RepID=UPI002F355986
MYKKELSVSLVMYCNDIVELTLAINSALKSSLVGKVYLIDNSPTNALKKLIKLDTERIVYLFQNSNLGFGRAHNIGIKLSEEERFKYHLILNPDVEFKENVLEKLHSYMEGNLKCGMTMPKVLYKNGDLQYLCKKVPTVFELFGKRLPFKSLQKSINNRLELHNFDYNQILNVPYLSGCFMFCRVSCFHKVGLFDDRYFMYMEDLDLSRSFHRHFETIFFPEVKILHGFRSESRVNKKLLKALIISAIKYFNKYGWVFDVERRKMNKSLLEKISKLN